MKKKYILFMVTDGVGFGHITRGLAVAKRLRALFAEYEPIFLTTSLASEIIRNEGFMYFYIPSKSMLPANVNASVWKNYMYQQLEYIVQIYEPWGIVYDGAAPYSALIKEISKRQDLKSIWIKRENYKNGWEGLEGYESIFSFVIVPREIGAGRLQGEHEIAVKRYCNPIRYLDEEEAYTRQKVRESLGIKKHEYLYYVQLGAGILNDIKDLAMLVQKEILSRYQTRILLGQSPIGPKIEAADSRVTVIRDYPNAKYFKGIDFAVSAAGYNTVHELTAFNVPTLLIPNEKTVIDDQIKRAQKLEDENMALMLKDMNELPKKLGLLERRQNKIRRRLTQVYMDNGAEEAARLIINFLQ